MSTLERELWDGNVTLHIAGREESFTLPVWETAEALDKLAKEHPDEVFYDFLRRVIAYVSDITGGTVISMGTAKSLWETVRECLDGKKKSPETGIVNTPNSPSSTDFPPSG